MFALVWTFPTEAENRKIFELFQFDAYIRRSYNDSQSTYTSSSFTLTGKLWLYVIIKFQTQKAY